MSLNLRFCNYLNEKNFSLVRPQTHRTPLPSPPWRYQEVFQVLSQTATVRIGLCPQEVHRCRQFRGWSEFRHLQRLHLAHQWQEPAGSGLDSVSHRLQPEQQPGNGSDPLPVLQDPRMCLQALLRQHRLARDYAHTVVHGLLALPDLQRQCRPSYASGSLFVPDWTLQFQQEHLQVLQRREDPQTLRNWLGQLPRTTEFPRS